MKQTSEIGILTLAARMQKLSDSIRREASAIYRENGIDFESKWIPVISLLSKKSPLSVVEIAGELGYAHPSIIAILNDLESKKLVQSLSHKNDGRKRQLTLTQKGESLFQDMRPLMRKMNRVNNKLIDNKHNLLKAIEQAEAQHSKKSFYERMQKQMKVK